MCAPEPPKPPPPKKERPLRYLLSRDQFDDLAGSPTGSAPSISGSGPGRTRRPSSGQGLYPGLGLAPRNQNAVSLR